MGRPLLVFLCSGQDVACIALHGFLRKYRLYLTGSLGRIVLG